MLHARRSAFVSFLFPCFLGALASLAPHARAQTAAPKPAPKPASNDVLAEVLAPIRTRHDVPALVAAIVTRDGVTEVGADGVRERGSETRVTVDDRMHLGSCTKSMTATLCARLVERKQLAWSATVGASFPELADTLHADWRDVTLEQLLTNRSGAPASLDADGLWLRLWTSRATPREQRDLLCAGVLKRAPEAPPGTKFIYSNAGFSIAGAMAERAAGQDYEALMQTQLFAPLGITTGGFGPPGSAERIEEPRGHGAKGKSVGVGAGADNPPAIAPAGRAHMSIGDWGRYVAAHLRRDVTFLSAESFAKLHAPVGERRERYAMGWSVLERPWGGTVLTHSGSNTSWYCVVWMAPEKDFAVLIATNQGGDAAVKACDEAAGALLARVQRGSAQPKAD